MNDDTQNNQPRPRKRGLTSVTLQWLAEKLKKSQRIKEELNAGKYQVDTSKVARAIVNGEGRSE